MFKENTCSTVCYHLEKQYSNLEKGIREFSLFCSFFIFIFLIALLFGGKGKGSPAHRKHIGSINPNCNVVEVIKGKYLYFAFQEGCKNQIVDCYFLLLKQLFIP